MGSLAKAFETIAIYHKPNEENNFHLLEVMNPANGALQPLSIPGDYKEFTEDFKEGEKIHIKFEAPDANGHQKYEVNYLH